MSDAGILILRLDAPLISFGGIAVDEKRPTQEFPGKSMLTGLLANALGWRHGEFHRLQRLQERLVYAVRRDRKGELLHDFHTVDLGQDFMAGGWTTRDRPEVRGGGNAAGTHIRDRHFLAGALYTVAVRLDPAAEAPRVEDFWEALRRPARPLFLGRKTCLPSRPLVTGDRSLDILEETSVLEALRSLPAWETYHDAECLLWWPEGEAPDARPARRFAVHDERDWTNQTHVGRRFLHEGSMPLEPRPGPEAGEEELSDG